MGVASRSDGGPASDAEQALLTYLAARVPAWLWQAQITPASYASQSPHLPDAARPCEQQVLRRPGVQVRQVQFVGVPDMVVFPV